MHRLGLLGGLVGLLVASTSEAAPPRFRRVAHSAQATYWAEPGLRVDVKRSEAFLERLGTLFPAPPEGWGIAFYLHRSEGHLRERVGYAVSGLTDMRAGRIDSARGYHPHELVHAVAGRFGVPPPLFSEGLAVALTARGELGGRDVDELAAEEMRARKSLEPFLTRFGEEDALAAYAVAGSFVSFLLDQHGIAPMVAFLESCGRSPARYEAAFRRAYGRSVASASVEWMGRLRAGPAVARPWQDPASWPGALLREGVEAPAPSAPLPSGGVALAADRVTTIGDGGR